MLKSLKEKATSDPLFLSDFVRSHSDGILSNLKPFVLENMVPNERSTLCGHLEPKMAKIGPELTEW